MIAFENFENIAGQALENSGDQQVVKIGGGNSSVNKVANNVAGVDHHFDNMTHLEPVEEELIENEEVETPLVVDSNLDGESTKDVLHQPKYNSKGGSTAGTHEESRQSINSLKNTQY